MKRSFASRIYSEKSYENINTKVSLLGCNSKLTADKFLNSRLILGILLFVVLLLFTKSGFVLAPLSSFAFYFIYEYFVLDVQIEKRRVKLERESIYFFEVLALTLEGGRNLKGSIIATTKAIESDISDEFKHALLEVDLGKSLSEALNGMKKRIPSETINNSILNITQSNKFGGSIIESLYNQVDFLREKQLQDVKRDLSKLPIKISVVSVLFYIPIMMLLLLSPILLKFFGG